MPVRSLFTAILVALTFSVSAAAQDAPDEAPAPKQKPAAAPAPEKSAPAPAGPATESICLLIESAAIANGLPVEFFARVIWRESRYNPNAVGPVTRSGERAQGIGQFMPGTAAERRVLDPFDPVEALPKSAELLRDLRARFGNLGLAAAAYNAGPQRVRDWLDGRRTLPRQTRNYVAAITGRTADEWAELGPMPREEKTPPAPPCNELNVIIKRAPNPFVAELERHVTEGAAKPWGVQLSAGFSRDKAVAVYAVIERRYRAVLAGHDPMIISARLLSRGTRAFYQVRAGAGSRAEADKLCASLHAAGGHCIVLRNPRG
jgi:Transglycosylase SLT domain/SPOR domain